MTIKEAIKAAIILIRSRRGIPNEDDWELMEAADVLAKHLGEFFNADDSEKTTNR